MNAIKMLKQQHREVEELFREFERATSSEERRDAFEQIADALAIHAAIEEKHFYPEVKRKQTEGILLESVEEHLEIKRVITDLLQLDPDDQNYEAKVTVLQENVDHHVEEEETDLFPTVEKLFDENALEVMGAAMDQMQSDLREDGDPRNAVPAETDKAAPI